MSKENTTNTNPTGGEGNTPATTAPPAAPPPAVEPPAATTPATPATPATPPDKTFSQADFDKAISKAQKDWEKKIADAEAKAKLSEDEKKVAEIAELRTQIQERDARDGVTSEAAKLGVKNPAMLYRLIKDELEFDDKGKVSNLKEVFESAKDYPEIFDTKPNASIDAGAGTTGGGQVLTKEKLAAMTPAEINALDWNAVSKVLSEK